MLAAATTQMRHEFRQKASLDAASPEAAAAVRHAADVARILRENVVQGRRAAGVPDTYSEAPPRRRRRAPPPGD